MFLHVSPPSPTSAKSDSHLSSHLPPVPPKRTPLLPPKQAVGKSREDIDRITKVDDLVYLLETYFFPSFFPGDFEVSSLVGDKT